MLTNVDPGTTHRDDEPGDGAGVRAQRGRCGAGRCRRAALRRQRTRLERVGIARGLCRVRERRGEQRRLPLRHVLVQLRARSRPRATFPRHRHRWPAQASWSTTRCSTTTASSPSTPSTPTTSSSSTPSSTATTTRRSVIEPGAREAALHLRRADPRQPVRCRTMVDQDSWFDRSAYNALIKHWQRAHRERGTASCSRSRRGRRSRHNSGFNGNGHIGIFIYESSNVSMSHNLMTGNLEGIKVQERPPHARQLPGSMAATPTPTGSCRARIIVQRVGDRHPRQRLLLLPGAFERRGVRPEPGGDADDGRATTRTTAVST